MVLCWLMQSEWGVMVWWLPHAFSTPYSLHQFVALQFILVRAPPTLRCLKNWVLWLQASCAVTYLDTVIIHSDTWVEHVQWAAVILECLDPQISQRCVWLYEGRYGIWNTTWEVGRCIHRWTKLQQLHPARAPRPKRRLGSSWGKLETPATAYQLLDWPHLEGCTRSGPVDAG